MAFWSSWFAPKCGRCGDKIVDDPVEGSDPAICRPCHDRAAAAEAAVEARRAAEEEARRKLEEGKTFGVDPRTQR
jgi:hypothetical protein